MSEAERTEIVALADRLFDLTHYELLDVPQTADRAKIQAAYEALAARYDPGKRKVSAGARPSMQLIHQRLVQARDTLSSATARTEYDRYLELRVRARAYEESVRSGAPPAPSGAPPTGDPASMSRLRPPAASDAERRNALALQVLSESAKIRAVRPSQVPPTGASARDMAAIDATIRASGPTPAKEMTTETLRRKADELRELAMKGQLEKLTTQAQVALAEGDPGLAIVHFRSALALKDSPELRAKVEDATKALSESATAAHLEQARFEEEHGAWIEAARSYEKAYKRRPEARFAERAANAYVQAGVEVKHALELAEEAAAKKPESAQTLITLASAYLRDGQLRRARTLLERAVKADPTDKRAEQMLLKI
jgi:tetratricopeptide (TPR) repeat protein